MTGPMPPRCIDFTDHPSMEAWAEALINLENLKKGFVYVAWFLSVNPSFFVEGYITTDQSLALRLNTAPNSIKNAILTLGTLGFLSWSWVRIGSTRARHLRPTLPRPNGNAVGRAAAPETGWVSSADATQATPDEEPSGWDNRRHGDTPVLPILKLLDEPAMDEHVPAVDPVQGSDRTQSGCDEMEGPRQQNPGVTALAASCDAEPVDSSVSPIGSESTQTGCDVAGTREAVLLRKRPRGYDPLVPLWTQPSAVQQARAQFHAERLDADARCRHDDCGSRYLAVVCAEEGRAFCARHGGHAMLAFSLAPLGLDRRW